jgi:hypothetical protein
MEGCKILRGKSCKAMGNRLLGSNPVEDMDVYLLGVLCVVRYRSLRRADHLSRGVLPSVVCLSVIAESRRGDLAPLGLSSHKKKCISKRKK